MSCIKHFYACDGELTFDKLSKIVEKYNIPHDVTFLSDSGWECCETSMCGVWYNREKNVIVFTQDNGYETDDGYSRLEYGDGYVSLSLISNE